MTLAARRLASLVAVLVPSRCSALGSLLGGDLAAAGPEMARLARSPRAVRLRTLALALAPERPTASAVPVDIRRHAIVARLEREALDG